MKLKQLMFSAALLAGLTLPAVAQSSSMRVNIPFSFYLGGQKMPAGEYVVQETGEVGAVIFHSVGAKGAAITLTEATGPASLDAIPGLRFERRAGEVYLMRVQVPGQGMRSVPSLGR